MKCYAVDELKKLDAGKRAEWRARIKDFGNMAIVLLQNKDSRAVIDMCELHLRELELLDGRDNQAGNGLELPAREKDNAEHRREKLPKVDYSNIV